MMSVTVVLLLLMMMVVAQGWQDRSCGSGGGGYG